MRELRDVVVPELGLTDEYPGVGDNIEHLLTFLAQEQPWLTQSENLLNRSRFHEVSEKIWSVITECQAKAMIDPAPDWLKDLIGVWNAEHAQVITLNYDTLVESAYGVFTQSPYSRGESGLLYPVGLINALLRNSMPFDGGGSEFDAFSLYKLHGSINWFYSGNFAATGEAIYYVPSKRWGPPDLQDLRFRWSVADKFPYIVPPITDKTSLFAHEALRFVWRSAAMALRSADEVYLLGYSLPETDLGVGFLLKQNVNRANHCKPKLIIANTNESVLPNIERILREYEIDDGYIGPDAIKEVVKHLKLADVSDS